MLKHVILSPTNQTNLIFLFKPVCVFKSHLVPKMATILHWKAYELKNKLFDKYLSPHKIWLDSKNEKFVVRQNSKKLLNFYFGCINIFFHGWCCLYILFNFLYSQNVVPVFMVILYVQLAGIFFLSTALNYLAVFHGEKLFQEYFNSIFHFNRFLRQIGYATRLPLKQSLWRGTV